MPMKKTATNQYGQKNDPGNKQINPYLKYPSLLNLPWRETKRCVTPSSGCKSTKGSSDINETLHKVELFLKFFSSKSHHNGQWNGDHKPRGKKGNPSIYVERFYKDNPGTSRLSSHNKCFWNSFERKKEIHNRTSFFLSKRWRWYVSQIINKIFDHSIPFSIFFLSSPLPITGKL